MTTANRAFEIRDEAADDLQAIAAVTMAAFHDMDISAHTEQFIIAALRDSGALAVSLVAWQEGRIVGHIAFSRVSISDGAADWYCLGPVSVLPECQGQGIGSALIGQGLTRLRRLNAKGCVLVGRPGFYSRFGFGRRDGLTYEGVPPEAFLALSLDGRWPQGEVKDHLAFRATQ
ncbi:MAG: N-acetyltransferase [Burkholderiaceae bacterium]|jgi:putative acetyltransferase|nr:N-acetyltransferase [Burkholderiaceae bacterium]